MLTRRDIAIGGAVVAVVAAVAAIPSVMATSSEPASLAEESKDWAKIAHDYVTEMGVKPIAGSDLPLKLSEISAVQRHVDWVGDIDDPSPAIHLLMQNVVGYVAPAKELVTHKLLLPSGIRYESASLEYRELRLRAMRHWVFAGEYFHNWKGDPLELIPLNRIDILVPM